MSRIWRSDFIVAEHRDLQANTMAVDSLGEFAVLAGRRHMGVVHLDKPSDVIYKVNRHSKWDVSKAEWSPHHQEQFALACNERVEIYSWSNSEVQQITTLKAHTRSISDLNWSIFDDHVLASASIDTYIHLWDVRDHKKPSMSFSAVAGASQAKWNKRRPHIIASSHEGDIRIWDTRKGTSPVQYITAHLFKIHNMDWCPYEENVLCTSSQDCTVKFWDVNVPQKREEGLHVTCPVWRSQFAPFGYGLVTVIVPPLRRGDNCLLLWNMKNYSVPVQSFFGHTDVVVEIGWRKPSGGSKNYQLVTFTKDHFLRVWTIDMHLQKACGHIELEIEDNEPSTDLEEIESKSSSTTRESDASLKSSPSGKSKDRTGSTAESPALPQNLHQEFSLANLNIPNVEINEMDASKRSCTVTVKSGIFSVCVKLSFPAMYPNNYPPSFEFCKGTNIDEEKKAKVLKKLKMVSQQQVKRNRSCLEPCLRQLVSALDALAAEDKGLPKTPESPYHSDTKTLFSPSSQYGFQDVSVPFPRTSGARFCGADILVVFTRPPHLQRINAPTDDTPRSLSALSAYLASHVVLPIKSRASTSSSGQYNLVYPPLAQSPKEGPVSLSSFYHQDRKLRKRRNLQDRRSSGSKQQSNCGAVLIYSISKLLPINIALAQSYVFGSDDISTICSKNAAIALREGCRDLVQVWSIVSLIANSTCLSDCDPEKAMNWANHPFARKMLQSLILHYGQHYDVQTAAMLASIFHKKASEKKSKKIMDIVSSGSSGSQISAKWWLKPGGSPYHTVGPGEHSFEVWSIVGALKRNRSNSWSDFVEEYNNIFDDTSKDGQNESREERESIEACSKLLDPIYSTEFDQYKMVYADVLYRWNLLQQRVQVLKTVSTPAEKHKGIEFTNICRYCKKEVTGPQCQNCKKYSFSCVICNIAVKGSSSFCIACGHGGHTTHMRSWFQDMEACPSGCGCKCLEANDVFGT